MIIEGDMGTVAEEVKDYSHEVPRLLKHYGLSPGITNISLKQDSLEEIFLKIVKEGEKND